MTAEAMTEERLAQIRAILALKYPELFEEEQEQEQGE